MENEGLKDANDAQILEFLRKERQKREEAIRDAEKVKKHPKPIKAYSKPRNILHGNQKPKEKSLAEIWRDEDEEAHRRREDEE